MKETDRYNDIIDLPRHVSPDRPHMPIGDRAAQFSPFAALTGYDDAINETARLTGNRIHLTDEQSAALDRRLGFLRGLAGERPEIELEYFVPDGKKSGGEYVLIAGTFKRFDEYEKNIVLTDGRRIPAEDIIGLEGEVFAGMGDEADSL